jgi:hypothetical protein
MIETAEQPADVAAAMPPAEAAKHPARPARPPVLPKETGGPKGLEPTRYGDWERNGRCTDF